MKTAKEILEMTRKESKLAKACDKLIEASSTLVESTAMKGHREALIDVHDIENHGVKSWEYHYGEIADMLKYKLIKLGYTTSYNENRKILTVMW